MKKMLFLLLFYPYSVFANYGITYIVIEDTIYDSLGNYLIIRQEAIIDKDGFEFKHLGE
jgi:hypothetical protein